MSDPNNPLIAALHPLTSRVRTDVTAIRQPDGSSRWSQRPLDTAALAQHVNGGPGRGVAFIKPGESVTLVGLLDFDSHRGETPWTQMAVVAGHVVDMLVLVHGCRPLAFRSSGGHGVHVYLLWDEPQDAHSVREFLSGVLADCGLRSGTRGVAAGEVEVFPRQASVPAGGFGNQAILPLAGASELLVYEPLSGMLDGAGRGALTAGMWEMSPPVPVLERPVRVSREPGARSGLAASGLGLGEVDWRAALDALTNTGEHELGYDDWRNIGFAIHHETGGSDEGLALFHEWSSRSSKYDGTFIDERVWPYIHSDGRAAVMGAGTIKHLASKLVGWREPVTALGAVEDVDVGRDPEADPRLSVTELAADRRAVPRATPLDRAADAAAEALKPVERRGVPPAKHLCTDLANANRLVAAYGRSVLVAAGKWYVWNGRMWCEDESDVYRFACKLSAIVRQEAKDVVRKAREATVMDGGPERVARAEKLAEALEKWSVKCEMRSTIEAAVGLAKKMLTVDTEMLDADPWLLNCRNGVVDLRTGTLGEHRPELFITKLVDLDHDPGADSGLWERTVLQITREEAAAAQGETTPVADFLRRWFGYCATGSVSEQVFVVHWGDGSNGKSTMLDVVARVLGSYASVAAPGLVASSGRDSERHPTELAALMGRRMVTAHESRDGAVLTDDVVKKITGGDMISARFMRGDFFNFNPTHKVQLLTNSKPTVKGQDHGIWRRVCLVAYRARFGEADEVAAGRATAIKDKTMTARLSAPAALQGVLAWIVRGAVEWYSDGGLRPPSAVVEASEDYRRSQDRVAQFIEECCEVGDGFEEPMMVGSLGLYPAYMGWCKEGGFFALARGRFVQELERAVPSLTFTEVYRKGPTGARRRVRVAVGIRLPE